MKEGYAVTYHVCNSDTGEAITTKAKVFFSCDPEQYGNGYSMYIKSPDEPFGGQGYDIRYDRDFHKDNIIPYIVNFYANRFDGKQREREYTRRWKLIGIRVWEAEFEED